MPPNERPVASVARKALTRSFVTSSPLISPIVAPATIATGKAHHTPRWTAASAASTSLEDEDRPKRQVEIAGDDRSSVTAHAAMPIVAFWKTRLRRFCDVRKTGEAAEK